jgi:hypothetical protein
MRGLFAKPNGCRFARKRRKSIEHHPDALETKIATFYLASGVFPFSFSCRIQFACI